MLKVLNVVFPPKAGTSNIVKPIFGLAVTNTESLSDLQDIVIVSPIPAIPSPFWSTVKPMPQFLIVA